MKKLSLFLILAFSGITAAKKASKGENSNAQTENVKKRATNSLQSRKIINMLKQGKVELTSQCGTVTPITVSESENNWKMVGFYTKTPSKKSAQKGLVGTRDNCTIYARELYSLEQGLTGGDSHKFEPVVVYKNDGVARSTAQATGNLVSDTGQVAAGAVEGAAKVAGNTVEDVGQALGNLF